MVIHSLSPEPDPTRLWIVCESGNRWLTAARRFVPGLMPPPLIPRIVSADLASAVQRVLGPGLGPGPGPGVILWEVRPDSVPAACQCLAQTAISRPSTLQLIADQGLSDRERLVLAEFPVAAMIRQPEQLSRLKSVVHGHFAAATQPVD